MATTISHLETSDPELAEKIALEIANTLAGRHDEFFASLVATRLAMLLDTSSETISTQPTTIPLPADLAKITSMH